MSQLPVGTKKDRLILGNLQKSQAANNPIPYLPSLKSHVPRHLFQSFSMHMLLWRTNLLPLLLLAVNYTEEENSRLYHLQGCVRLPGEAERAIHLEGQDLRSRPSAPATPTSRP